MAREVHIAREYQGKRYKRGKIGTIWWDTKDHEADVTISVDFLKEDWLIKADVLKDVIGLLTQEYEMILILKREAVHE